ncbi:sensor histidine kinase [Vibrio maerlii]|uniref:sensor histidine kinase n=1 Tax=Vibrio maerlii TaxID=2231648 RepID=UPI000E3C24C0|nr:sensor histidine kinase [Vibrio maerlii]
MWTKLSFRKRLLIVMTLSGLIELLILAGAGFMYIKSSQEQEMGEKALGVATFLAKSPNVIDLIQRHPTDDEQERFSKLTHLIGAAFIVVGDHKGTRIIHPIAERVGKPMKGGDNEKALVYGESYVSFAQGSMGYSVRGKTAVFNEAGEIIGVVSVGYLLDRLQDRIEPYLAFLITMALLVVAANAVLSNYASRRFQKAILGFEPEEIGRLYVELDVTMGTVKEGILSIDSKGVLRSINTSACQILNLNKSEVVNRPLADVLPESDLADLVTTERVDNDVEIVLNGQRLIANRSPIVVNDVVVGAVSSFRRRDEINELTEQLSKTKAYAELLRSQTHEHRNKLNTISGMVQLGELEAVQTLIGQETAHYQTLIQFLRETVNDPLIAGMLLGKTERARELGLELYVEEGSRLQYLPEWIESEDVVTLLGNLIDNAFDATFNAMRGESPFSSGRRQIEVSVSDYGKEIILEVIDQGTGFSPSTDLKGLLEKGKTTKQSTGHGVGLYLVSKITERYFGEIDMVNNTKHGARVTVYLPKEEMQ